MRAVLTIAGSDSGGGAGIQADLKTFAAFGVYGTSAVTAVTSQNTLGVDAVLAMPAGTVRSQIASVADDVVLSAIKTGMLATGEIVQTVADLLAGLRCRMVVVDPVMLSTNPGHRTLLTADAVSVMKEHLLPLATVVTPNSVEAGALSGRAVESLEDAREAAKRIFDLGPGAVLIKGGHLTGADAVDLLYDGTQFTEFSAGRLAVGPLHGTGCTFASALAAAAALGDDLPAAVQRAKHYVTGAIKHSMVVGRGSRVLDHFWERSARPGAAPPKGHAL